jgi:hypothetical protein
MMEVGSHQWSRSDPGCRVASQCDRGAIPRTRHVGNPNGPEAGRATFLVPRSTVAPVPRGRLWFAGQGWDVGVATGSGATVLVARQCDRLQTGLLAATYRSKALRKPNVERLPRDRGNELRTWARDQDPVFRLVAIRMAGHYGRAGHRGAQRHPRHMVNAEGRVTPPGHGRPAGERGMVPARYGKRRGGVSMRHISRARVCYGKPLHMVASQTNQASDFVMWAQGRVMPSGVSMSKRSVTM